MDHSLTRLRADTAMSLASVDETRARAVASRNLSAASRVGYCFCYCSGLLVMIIRMSMAA
jgi:hypothetical protein